MVTFVARATLIAFVVVAAVLQQASAQDARQNEAGQFDFYVLSLSWSPSFCAAAADRQRGRAPTSQCGARPYAFVVHGLWPQYDRGFPEYCQVPAPRLDHGIVSSMLDLMPAPHLIFNEWDKHGTCSGLEPRAYFETIRKARAVVKIPPEYINLQEPLSVTPAAVEEAFETANPGLSPNGMAIGCDKKRLTEVRICLSKELQFRDCGEIAETQLQEGPGADAATARELMNYRHAFHAGNFADVHKHAVLARILAHLQRKPAAFRVIDTHAGAGRYDLLGPEPSRSGEWHNGIERLWNMRGQGAPASLLAPYLKAVEALNADGKLRFYPGSPLIAASLLRPQDRLVACELEPGAAASLAAALRGNRRAKAVTIVGWTALGAYVPPKERRGLVVIDPPFEETGEFERLSSAFSDAYRKWPTGIYLMWYPIKERSGPDALARRLHRLGLPDVLRCELTLGPPRGDAGLVGSGLIVVNPPHTLQPDLQRFMPAIARALSPAAASRIDWLAEETVPSR